MSSANDGDAASAWLRVKQIAGAALDQPPEQREAFVASACQGDAELHRSVQVLLSDDPVREEFLQSPIPHAALRLLEGSSEAVLPADRFNHYRIERVVGSGGLGTVYRGHVADDPEQPPVAIKVLRRGMASDDVLRRFRQEQQLLARLDHPHIARFIGGGTTEHGLNYLVMEYIDGQAIDRFCDERSLSIPQRLRLFDKVCAAVQYSHRNLIVHRDLKPSNILVVADGTPKLLDFGIAKLIEDGSSGLAGDPTITAQRFITPQYASPEQVAGGPITTASDVYSLGVILYELLSGHRPYDLSTCLKQDLPHALGQAEPAPPSTRILQQEQVVHADGTTTQLTPASVSQARASSPERLRRELAGDLDTIVLTAMHRDLARRYPSVEQLAEDLSRHLHQLPIRARPDRFVYRAGKFLRRNKLAAASAALVLLATVAGIAGLSAAFYQSRAAELRIASEAEKTRRTAARAARIKEFLEDMLTAADPQSEKRETTVRAVLDRTAARLNQGLAEDPEVLADVHYILGRTYLSLGVLEDADDHLRQARNLWDRAPDHSLCDEVNTLNAFGVVLCERGNLQEADEVLKDALTLIEPERDREPVLFGATIHNLGVLRRQQGNFDEAERLFRQAFEVRKQAAGEHAPETIEAMSCLATMLYERARYEQAEQTSRFVLAARRELWGPRDPRVGMTLGDLATTVKARGDLPAAGKLFQEAIEIQRAAYPGHHPDLAYTLNNYAVLLKAQGDLHGAEAVLREVLESNRTLYGDKHHLVAATLRNLATVLRDLKDYAAAGPLFEEALSVLNQVFPEGHPDTASCLNNLGQLYRSTGDHEAAASTLTAAVAMSRKVFGSQHPNLATALENLAQVKAQGGDYGAAEPLLREVVAIRRANPEMPKGIVAYSESLLGSCLTKLGRYDEAEPLLLNSYPVIQADKGPTHQRTLEAIQRLVNLYEAWGQPDKAAEYRALLEDSETSAEPRSGN